MKNAIRIEATRQLSPPINTTERFKSRDQVPFKRHDKLFSNRT